MFDNEHHFIQSFFKESPVGFNLCKMDGLWIASNPAFLEIIGYSQEEAVGLSYWQLTPAKYHESEQIQLQSLQTSGNYGPYEKEFIRKDGDFVAVRLNGFIVEYGGEKCIWSSIEDISAERQRQKEQEKMQQQLTISSRLAALGTLAAGVAHEINNPMQIIRGKVENLQRLAALGGPMEKKQFEDIYASIKMVDHIVKGLNVYARPADNERGKTIDLHLCINRFLEMIGSLFHSDDIEVSRKLEASQAGVIGTEGEFQQVLMNLFSNARDALVSSEKKKITLRTYNENDRIILEFSDTGAGIRIEDQDKIFDAFFTTKEVGRGVGLGLGISYSIIQKMAGEMKVDSSLGVGTTFYLSFPLSPLQPMAQLEQVSKSESGRLVQGSFLIVEDDPIITELLTSMLDVAGVSVASAPDGFQALELLADRTFDCMLTDQKMPKMRGDQLIRIVRQDTKHDAMKIVVMSGDFEDAFQSNAPEENRVNGYLQKPFSTDDLHRLVLQALDS